MNKQQLETELEKAQNKIARLEYRIQAKEQVEPLVAYLKTSAINGWCLDNYFKDLFYRVCNDTNITSVKLTKLELNVLASILFKYNSNEKQIQIFTQDLQNLHPDDVGTYSIRFRINSENMSNSNIEYINRQYGKNIPTNTLTDIEKQALEEQEHIMIVER